MSPAYYFLAFLNKGRVVSAWHVMRIDGKTVCGRNLPLTGTFGGRVSVEQLRKLGDPNVCSSCFLMKDAETVRLA
jgi:hypothetical protein